MSARSTAKYTKTGTIASIRRVSHAGVRQALVPILLFRASNVNDLPYRIVTAVLGGSFAVLAAGWVAKKCSFYKATLGDTQGRALPLDGLRGLMAWCVFVHHTDVARQWLRTGTWSCDAPLVLFLGTGAVMVFFMITGFLFWGKALEGGGKIAPFPFWLKRLKRLAPLYLLSAGLVFLVVAKEWLEAPGPTRLEFAARLLGLGCLTWSRLPGFLLITANAGVQWSLWYEWRFYLALPLLAWFAPGKRLFLLCGLCLVGLLWPGLSANDTIFWLAFLPGVAAVYFAGRPGLREALRSDMSALVAVIWCAGVLILSHASGYGWSLLAVIPLFWTAAAGNTYRGVLVHPVTRMLGTISYSVYLLHGIVLMVVLRTVGKVINLAELPLPAYGCLVAATAVLVVVLCSITYRYIEHPFLITPPSGQKATQSRPASLVQGSAVHTS